MTRLLITAAAALALAGGTAGPAAAYECRGTARTVCDAVGDVLCDGCETHVDPCDVVICGSPYVGCIPGYFCV